MYLIKEARFPTPQESWCNEGIGHCNLIRVLTVDGTDHIATVSVSTLCAKHIAELVFQAGFRDFKNFLFQYNNISIAPVNL
ncbi:hypothetical protein SUGI_0076160 [Cryptomeria japonica]|nr:hypothetical protein SUGI_0076160 [Cryptomeria japonica]